MAVRAKGSRDTANSGLKSRTPATLARLLGHSFVRPELLREALTHRGAAVAGDGPRFGNERLEFLGDRVLGLVIADLVHESFPDEPEGVLSRRYTGLVRREALEEVAAGLGLGAYLILAESDIHSGARDNRGIQADACEAVIGALYLDGGLDVARGFILKHWRPLLGGFGTGMRDAKTRLQEWAQARGLPLPTYREVARSGPAHVPEFVIEAAVKGQSPARGRASSKRAAEQVAAENLLSAIAGENRTND